MLDALVANPGAMWTQKAFDSLQATKDNVLSKMKAVEKKVGLEKRFTKKSDSDEALNWAKNNPNDPRSVKILQKLGVK